MLALNMATRRGRITRAIGEGRREKVHWRKNREEFQNSTAQRTKYGKAVLNVADRS
jgi:hypothetical protein